MPSKMITDLHKFISESDPSEEDCASSYAT
jgi:hypothetical protein